MGWECLYPVHIFVLIGNRKRFQSITVLDPRKLPETISDVESYDIEEINELVNFYGTDKKDTHNRKSVF